MLLAVVGAREEGEKEGKLEGVIEEGRRRKDGRKEIREKDILRWDRNPNVTQYGSKPPQTYRGIWCC